MSIKTEAAERDSNIIIEQQLSDRLAQVEEAVEGNVDAVAFMGPLFPPADNEEIKDAVEAIQPKRQTEPKRRTLSVILETGGGLVDVTERIARIFRHHYRRVDFLVPSYAMSAGTILAMSGDAIHMDYASVLGPIDPQVRKGERYVPALGYLEKFNELIEKSQQGELTTAEMTYLVQNFDPAEMYRYEQERELSIALLEEWLVKYKFKNWKVTETTKTRVTPGMRRERANQIGDLLNRTERWHSHDRGISMEVLRRDLNLLIQDFGADENLATAIGNYYRLLRDYQMRRAHYRLVIHSNGESGYVGF